MPYRGVAKSWNRQNLKSRANDLFQKVLHAKARFSDRKYESRLSKNSNLSAKIAEIWQIALFNYFCMFQFFATNYMCTCCANTAQIFIYHQWFTNSFLMVNSD